MTNSSSSLSSRIVQSMASLDSSRVVSPDRGRERSSKSSHSALTRLRHVTRNACSTAVHETQGQKKSENHMIVSKFVGKAIDYIVDFYNEGDEVSPATRNKKVVNCVNDVLHLLQQQTVRFSFILFTISDTSPVIRLTRFT